MDTFKRAVRTCGIWIAEWKGDYRVWVILVFEVSVIARNIIPVCRFALANGESVPVFSLPLLMTDYEVATGLPKITLFLGVIALFAELPFSPERKFYQFIRTDRNGWLLANIFYVMTASFLYLLFITVMSFLFWLPAVSVQDGWGSLITHTFEGEYDMRYSLSYLPFPQRVFFRSSYWEAFLYTATIAWTVFVLIGLMMCTLNLYASTWVAGTLAGGFLVFLDPVLVYFLNAFNGWLFYLSPVNWVSISCLKEYRVYRFTVLDRQGIMAALLCWLIFILFFMSIKWKRKEFLQNDSR